MAAPTWMCLSTLCTRWLCGCDNDFMKQVSTKFDKGKRRLVGF